MDKLNKLSLPTTIIIASIILGGFYYTSQVNKQQSIERQQEIKLQDDKRAEEAKAEQTRKEYVAKRKGECYELFRNEQKRVYNAENYGYVETCFDYSGIDRKDIPLETIHCQDDTCEVIYKDNETGKYFRMYY